jgi:signal transduction histidine kinase
MLGITGIVAAVLVLSLAWDFQYQQGQLDKDLLAKADLVAKQQLATRKFLAGGVPGKMHGDKNTPPSPSEVGKGVDELFADLANSQAKQTRLVVRADENAPDPFEQEALKAFENNPDSPVVFARTIGTDGSPVFRYVMPLREEESCLKCHGEPAGEMDLTGHVKEGMKEGDLAGAISVVLPMTDALGSARAESFRLAAGVLALAGLTLGLIWFMLWRQVSMPLQQLVSVAESVGGDHIQVEHTSLEPLRANRETAIVADAFESMSGRLQELYAGLEQKVMDRTAQLEKANQGLAEANRDLERASHQQSEFLAMVSHDFKTPLTSIITFTELLLDDAAGQINREQKEYLEDVLDSSGRLLTLVNDLLDLSRLEAGRIKLFCEVLDIKDLVKDAERTLRPLADKKGVTLNVTMPDGLPLVRADALRITQVLLNLMGNAIKFTPGGGFIWIDAREDGRYLQVAVKDTGIGIAPDEHEAVFEAFRQSGKVRPEGSGLGLALAKSLLGLHGGRIWLESELGRGSTFYFTLPLCGNEGRVRHDDGSETHSDCR